MVAVLKRSIDVVSAVTGLALLLPVFPILALMTRWRSPGPILFRQRRAGRLLSGGSATPGRPRFEEFDMVKLRTMRVDAEGQGGPVLAEVDDPRVTPGGRFLRRTRLDELPQLWNVLRGDMSLVGPRPERPELARQLSLASPYFEERMRNVKPGITGLAQVNLGYTGRMPATCALRPHAPTLTNPFKLEEASDALADDMRIKLLYDLTYAAARERVGAFLRMEVSILIRTPLVMLRGMGR